VRKAKHNALHSLNVLTAPARKPNEAGTDVGKKGELEKGLAMPKAVENTGENEETWCRTKGLSVPDWTPPLARQPHGTTVRRTSHAKATRKGTPRSKIDSLSFAFLGVRGKADGRFAIVALVVLVFAAFLLFGA
jgi:hypothetical protein